MTISEQFILIEYSSVHGGCLTLVCVGFKKNNPHVSPGINNGPCSSGEQVATSFYTVKQILYQAFLAVR